MRELTEVERQQLAAHAVWLQHTSQGERLDWSGANLQGVDLRGAILRHAQLSEANLVRADLHGADLRFVNLSNANLTQAYLDHANLWGANLRGANLQGADLRWADLGRAIYSPTRVFQGAPLGSRQDLLLLMQHPDGSIEVRTGCFHGTLEEFVARITGTYAPEVMARREYVAVLGFIRQLGWKVPSLVDIELGIGEGCREGGCVCGN